ncbi:MAG: hypothetical protein EOO81_11465 [Oxalobacteraceae bacterium]|nr:MAG: hypothetical protein EOO81_11465 [Oxalobacteraceae bacterium]
MGLSPNVMVFVSCLTYSVATLVIGRIPMSWPFDATKSGNPKLFWALNLGTLATGLGFLAADLV